MATVCGVVIQLRYAEYISLLAKTYTFVQSSAVGLQSLYSVRFLMPHKTCDLRVFYQIIVRFCSTVVRFYTVRLF